MSLQACKQGGASGGLATAMYRSSGHGQGHIPGWAFLQLFVECLGLQEAFSHAWQSTLLIR